MPTKIRSGGTGKTPHKTSYSITIDAHVKKKKLRKMILPYDIIEEEEEE